MNCTIETSKPLKINVSKVYEISQNFTPIGAGFIVSLNV